ncbi:MAG: hypothetical protein IJF25_00320 [Oscillospiraceae bacterium]|nr:hypothetical protein [Oscillospiraceae bacterium]MBQ4539251.1 hypothetical protein [Oscillospiraceae bacterium]
MMNISPEKLDMLLKTAGQRLGKDPQVLKNQLQSGSLDGLGIDQNQQRQIGGLLKDPQAMAKFFEQPQIKDMLQQLMKGR